VNLEMAQETCEVKVRRGESVDRALRRLKKALDKEGVLKTMRSKRCYEKPSEKKKRLANSRRGRR
jgi:small subunit ribosomal protein S21